jgi:hypothetical protein
MLLIVVAPPAARTVRAPEPSARMSAATRSDGVTVRPMKWMEIFRALPPWRKVLYVVGVVGALAVLVWDIADKEAQYTTVAFLVLIALAAVALRAPNRT